MSSEAINRSAPYLSNVRRGRQLEYLTIAWNSIEAIASIGAGLLAGSISLVGFGVDSVIETSSGAILLRRLRDGERGERRERIALKLVGISFLLLAAYVAFNAVKSLVMRKPPEASYVGTVAYIKRFFLTFSLRVIGFCPRHLRRSASSG